MAYTKYTLLANSKNYGATRAASTIKYLVYHYTANKTDKAVSNANYFKNNVVKASAHYFVDDTTVYQSVPDLSVAWAVGGSKYSDCATTGGGTMYGKITNTNSISIEMCSTNGAFTEATLANAAELGKELMKKYNISINNVYTHFLVTGKKCPGHEGWYGKSSPKWDAFKARLSSSSSTTTSSTSTTTSVYSKTQFIKDVQSAIGVTVDGIAGSKTLAATVTVSKTKNNKHAVVKPIQKYLNFLGYSCGTADGVAGSKFDTALKQYQSKVVGMSNPDGEATAKGTTWKYLLGLK